MSSSPDPPPPPPSSTNKASSSSSPPSLSSVQNMLSGYFSQLSAVRSVADLMELNDKQFGTPTLQADKFTAGAVFGFASGMAARQALKVTAILCGMGFMSLQMLSYYGYVHVNWRRVESDVQNALDLNRDGQIDAEDFHLLKDKFMKVVTWGLPSAAGFGTGFVLGLRKW
eukprot:GHVS01082088.1.p1 GENE.GHVS01082088.1~~GHVS01082088.1.p1  ORF type:complete len:192 (-),score=88.85 GHVS01082088.1:218-727(-)